MQLARLQRNRIDEKPDPTEKQFPDAHCAGPAADRGGSPPRGRLQHL
jgi:hypothetical protein